MSNGNETCLFEDQEFEMCGIMFRPMIVTEDSPIKVIDGHTHFFDHVMVIIKGECDIVGKYPDGEIAFQTHCVQGEAYPVDKGIEHEITPTVLPYMHHCIFPSRLSSGKVAGQNTGWKPSSAATGNK